MANKTKNITLDEEVFKLLHLQAIKEGKSLAHHLRDVLILQSRK